MVARADRRTDGARTSEREGQLRVDLSLYLLAQLVVQRNAASFIAAQEVSAGGTLEEWGMVKNGHIRKGFDSRSSRGGGPARACGGLGGRPDELRQAGAVPVGGAGAQIATGAVGATASENGASGGRPTEHPGGADAGAGVPVHDLR